VAEGYLETQHGAVTFVAQVLPEELPKVPGSAPSSRGPAREGAPLSQVGTRLLAARHRMPGPLVPQAQRRPRAFRQGVPALDAFPRALWGRALGQCWHRSTYELLHYGEHSPLCETIAAYLGAGRGVHCTAEQVIVAAGSQQGLDLTARVLLDPGDTA
jgi:GntR family transcriptional regulator/MocR family aminotransferase